MREKIRIQDFHIGFEYEELQQDSRKHFNRGKIWVHKRYGFNSPRLHKMKALISAGLVRQVKEPVIKVVSDVKEYNITIHVKRTWIGALIARCKTKAHKVKIFHTQHGIVSVQSDSVKFSQETNISSNN